MLGRRELLAGGVALLWQASLFKKVFALPQARVLAMRHWAAPGYTRVVIDVSQRVRFSGHRLSNPERVYVDISPARLDPFLANNSTLITQGLVRRVRAGQNRPEVVRVALDVEGLGDFRVFSLESPFRIVVDLRDKTALRGRPQAEDWPPKKEKEEDPRQLSLVERFHRGLGTIVLDPGHGGKDPGAIGPGGLEEKVVVLDVGKSLVSLLKKALPGNRILLTRSADRFLALEERTALANTFGADLFISIHANASRRRNARGIETYLLSGSSNRRALEVAARENGTSVEKLSDLQIILHDLLLRSKVEESTGLATTIQSALISRLKTSYRDVRDLGVKKAPFYVLLGAQMPSVLVETSFISNPLEERRLRSRTYREALASAIAEGAREFISTSSLIVRAY